MQAVTTIGLDIAKSVFQVHGVDAEGNVLIRRQLKRRYLKRTSRLLVFRPSFAIQGIELFIRQLDIDGGDILFQMRDPGRAGNGEHDGTALEHPGKRDLARSGVMGLGYGIQDRAAFGETACSQRIPGNEADRVLFAIIQHVFAAAIDEIVAVLHGRQSEHLRGGFDISDGNVT